jgi:hypothetical protein
LTYPITDFFGNPRPDTSNPNAFDVGAVEYQGQGGLKQATLTSITPSVGYRGHAVNVTLTGTSLSTTTSINVTGTGVTVSNLNVVSDTSVTATFTIASNANLTSRSVTVTTAYPTNSNAVTFTVAGPSISGLTPSTGERGQGVASRPGVSITISGVDLTGATGLNGLGTGVTASNFTVVNDTTITATLNIAANAPVGVRNIGVVTPNGNTNTEPFTVTGPSLTSLSPSSGIQGTSVNVTLIGSDLTGATGLNGTGNGVTASNFAVVNDTTVTATLTIGAAATVGSRNIGVVTPDGNTNTEPFAVTSPTLTSISPASGSRSSGTPVNVTLTGSGLTGTTNVVVSGSNVSVSNVHVVSDTQVTATFTISGSAATGSRSVHSINSGGATSNNVTFTVNN